MRELLQRAGGGVMTPKEAIERLKHWPEMTEMEKLRWLWVAVLIKEAMVVSRLAGRPLSWPVGRPLSEEDKRDILRLYEEILVQASGNLTPADGELWEVWREFFC